MTRNLKKKILTPFLIGFFLFMFYFPFFSNIIIFLPNQKEISDFQSEVKTSDQGFIDESGQEIFWFIHMTDFHYNNPQSGVNFDTFFNIAYQEINPLFVINTGDLVTGTPTYGIDPQQWVDYRECLDRNNLNSSMYIDLIGNHDVSLWTPDDSYYLEYSMIGKDFGVTQYSFNKSFSFGKYAFICLDTTKDSVYTDGLDDFNKNGYLYPYELNWYEGELEKYKDFDTIFTFGHNAFDLPGGYYNINPTIDYVTDVSGLTFDELNAKYDIFSYICGHSHRNIIQENNGLFEIETADFDTDPAYRIIALDHGQFSTSVEALGSWPQGVITYPPTSMFLDSKFDPSEMKIRALAWDPNGVNSVKWCAYNTNDINVTNWSPMSKVSPDEPLWQGNWSSILNNGNIYKIKVNITGGSGQTIKEITYTFKDNPPDTPPDDSSNDLPNNPQDLGLIPIIIVGGILITVISITGAVIHRSRKR